MMKLIFNHKTNLNYIRLYCTKKPSIVIPKSPKELNKNVELLEQTDEAIANSSEECTKFEKQAIKQVLIEKEQDANLRSRLSKECKILFSRSSPQPTSVKYGNMGEIRLNSDAIQKGSGTDWLSYNFDQFQALASSTNNSSPLKLTSCPESYKDATISDKNALKGKGNGASKDDGSGSKVTTAKSPRPIRQEPGRVLLAFIPMEWLEALMPKTGVTGLGTLLFTLGTFLVSKEYYVLEHEYYSGLSVLAACTLAIVYLGPATAKYLDKEIDTYEKSWNDSRNEEKQYLEESIMQELHGQFQYDGQEMLIQAKRENVHLQLEEEYRMRQMYAYEEVKKRLDYHVELALAKQRIQHKNLIEFVTKEVVKSITPEMQDKLVYYSIDQIVLDLEKEKNKK